MILKYQQTKVNVYFSGFSSLASLGIMLLNIRLPRLKLGGRTDKTHKEREERVFLLSYLSFVLLNTCLKVDLLEQLVTFTITR